MPPGAGLRKLAMTAPNQSQIHPTPPARHYVPRLAALGATLTVALWFACGGPARLTSPHYRHWKLPDGDTVEILTQNNEYSVAYQVEGRVVAHHYFLIQFRSTLKDAARDKRDVRGILEIVCAMADSLGYRRINIQPTKASFFDFVKYGLDHWATVDSGGHCRQDGGS